MEDHFVAFTQFLANIVSTFLERFGASVIASGPTYPVWSKFSFGTI
ncbi:MAG: hypothetical protein P4L33_05460 [Capsulimonadaceae bacterium]|nr:hypothetical protein [Capsulimonadaceae bacterium]